MGQRLLDSTGRYQSLEVNIHARIFNIRAILRL